MNDCNTNNYNIFADKKREELSTQQSLIGNCQLSCLYHKPSSNLAYLHPSSAFPPTTAQVMTSKPASLPDVLVAVNVNSMELVLQVFVLHICHVIDHLQNHKARQDRQH